MPPEKAARIEAEYKESELRYRSDLQLKIDSLIIQERARTERAEKYYTFLDMIIKRETDRAAFRAAVMEKGLIALSIYLIGLFGTLLWDGTVAHLKAMTGK